MLVQLAAILVPVGGDLRAAAVDHAISALFDVNAEVQAQLDRIESKLDAVKNVHQGVGWTYLDWALKPHRSLAQKRKQVSQALDAFVNAAAIASDDPLSRSIARVYQAVCWHILGSSDDVRDCLFKALTDAYEAIYQAAIQYNEPQQTAMDMRQSWAQRHRPGWEVTDRKALRRMEAGTASALDRLLKSPTRPARRLQTQLKPMLDQANLWAASVQKLYARAGDQNWLLQGPMTQCRAYSHGEPGKPTRATLYVDLRLGATIDLRGLSISYVEAVPVTVAGLQYADVRLKVSVAGNAKRERAAYSSRPWVIPDQDSANPVLPRRGSALTPDRNWLWSGTPVGRPGIHAVRLGPGSADEVSGWRRFRDQSSFIALELVPAGPGWPLVNPHDPRPTIKADCWMPGP
jgi:hypothetical protein